MNIGFVQKTKDVYEFDCGNEIYILEGINMTGKLQLFNRKIRPLNGDLFNEKQCQIDLNYINPKNGIRYAEHIRGARITKCVKYYNEQILEQIQQRYAQGGQKYLESEKKIQSLES